MQTPQSPHIIFKIEGFQYYGPGSQCSPDHKKKSDFYRCKTDFDAVDYFSRENAVEKHDIETSLTIQKLIDKTDASNKDILNYAKDRPGSTGLWNKKGDLSKEEVAELRKQMRSTESTIWSSVISFSESFGQMNCNNKAKAQQVVSNTIDYFFEKANLNPDNMVWWGGFHLNTDNPHIHLLFFEKEPQKINSKGKHIFSNYKLPKSSFNDFKSRLAYEFKDNKFEYYQHRDAVRNSLLSDIKKGTLYNEVLHVKSELKDINSKQFGRLNKENQILISNLTFKILDEHPENKKKYDEYIAGLWNEQTELVSLHNENKIPIPQNVKNFATRRIDDFHGRLFNATFKAMMELQVGNTILFNRPPRYINDKENFPKEYTSKANSSNYRRKIDLKNIKNFILTMNRVATDTLKQEEIAASLARQSRNWDISKKQVEEDEND